MARRTSSKIFFILTAMVLSCSIAHGDMTPAGGQKAAASGARKKPQALAKKKKQKAYPGLCFEACDVEAKRLFRQAWQYRQVSYEMIFQDRQLLGKMIYGLALKSRDISSEIAIDTFMRGAQGFHYSMAQVLEWANSAGTKTDVLHTQDELDFLNQLIKDKVIKKSNGSYVKAGRISHVLGAAPGKKRTLAVNLNHERLHVFWDQNTGFRNHYAKQWRDLAEPERQVFLNDHTVYKQSAESQVAEEWAIWKNESISIKTVSEKWGKN